MNIKCYCYLLIISFLSACQYESEENLLPTDNCNAENQSLSYTVDIQSILVSYRCVSCHNAGLPSGGIRLDSYENVQKLGENGFLIGVMTHADGFSAMPPSADKVIDCDIRKVQKWIEDGMPNN